MKDEENSNYGKLYFIEVGISKDKTNYFGNLTEINSYSNYLKKFELIKGKAMGITSNGELLVWQFEKQKFNSPETKKEQKYISKSNYLLKNPIFIYNKIKMKNIAMNKTMCLGLDINGNVLVWGENNDGLLGLGYDITSVKSPFIIEELKDIVEISLSDNHAVVLNSIGVPFSWGLGKFGELGQERSIYNPFPQQMSTENLYSKVFCGNLITCFLDFEGHFSYYGVIIRNLSGNNSTITMKNLLNDELNYDGRILAFEKTIEELEKDKILNVVIGNGFVGLLSDSGIVYVLEFNDKLTKLYSKYFCYNINIANNEIFGLAKNNINIDISKNLSENTKLNYYMCKWKSKFESENSISSNAWTTSIWKISEDFNTNYKFLYNNNNYKNNLLFFLNKNINEKKEDLKHIFELESEYNDSVNLKFKRVKSKNSTIINEMSINGMNKSRFLTKNLNKTYNSFLNKGIPYFFGPNHLRNKSNSIFGARNSNYGLINLRRKNKSNTMKIKESYKRNHNYLDKNNIDTNKYNDDNNIYDDTLEFKEKELIKYRNEINNIINNYKNKNFKSLNFAEEKENYNKLIKDNSTFNNNQGIVSKNNIPYSGRNSKYSFNLRKRNSKENIENIKLKKHQINNHINNFNQRENDSNLEDFFGKESSNIIKNDIYSDINELSNTNLNYLSPNMDISNKRYNFNNSNNLMINSDRNKNNINNDTLNFSGPNYSNKRLVDDKKIIQNEFFGNNGELSPCFSKGHESINLINSISSGKTINIDKSINDFFSDDGNKQSKNNLEIKLDKNELYQISNSEKVENKKNKMKNLNIDIQDSNYENSTDKNNNSYRKEKISIRKNMSGKNNNKIDGQLKINLNYLKKQFILNSKDNNICKVNKCPSFHSLKAKLKIKISKNFKANFNNKCNSSPNLLSSNYKNLNLPNKNKSFNIEETNTINNKNKYLKKEKDEYRLKLFNNKDINNFKSELEKIKLNNLNDNQNNKNTSKEIDSNNIYLNPQDSFGNSDYISNEGRRTGKFNKLSDDIDTNNIKCNKNLEQQSFKKNKESSFNNCNNNKNELLKNKNNLNNRQNEIISTKKYDNIDLPVQINNGKNAQKRLINKKINKNTLLYFCFLINHYYKKMSYKMCIYEILNYHRSQAKKYATKMIYRMMKTRIIFYEIKFFRRIKKIHRFLIKYEMRLNMIKDIKNSKN